MLRSETKTGKLKTHNATLTSLERNLELQALYGCQWEIVEEYDKAQGRVTSSLLSMRMRIDRGYLVRTFHQFFDGTVTHVSMSETYVPDPNEQWQVKAV